LRKEALLNDYSSKSFWNPFGFVQVLLIFYNFRYGKSKVWYDKRKGGLSVRYWDHFKRAFIPIALILIGLAIFYTLSARDNMVLTLLGAAIVGVILFLVMRHVNQVEED